LQGLLSRDAGRNVSTIADYESKRAVSAYRLADEMLKARWTGTPAGAGRAAPATWPSCWRRRQSRRALPACHACAR